MKKALCLFFAALLAAVLLCGLAFAAESFEYELSVEGVESDHPYANNVNQSWVIECDGAQSITLTFHEDSELQTLYDYLYFYDINGSQLTRKSGDFGGSTVKINGDYVKLTLTSNGSTVYWGFKVTKAVAVLTDSVCDLSVGSTQNGTLTLSSSSVEVGQSVVLNPVPAVGFKLGKLYANSKEINGTIHTPTCDTVYTAVFIPDKELVAEGECGDKLNWCIYDDGELCIYGLGNMSYSSVPWDKYKAYIEKVTVCEGVTGIADSAFASMPLLTQVSLSKDLVSIGANAFSGCSAIKTLSLGQSVQSIGAQAFANCTSLETVNIPAAAKTFGTNVFSGCTALVSAGPAGGEYNIVCGWVDAIPANAFYGAANLKNIAVASGIAEIGTNAFYSSGITAITLGSNVKTVGDYAFSNCKTLTNVQFTEGLESIGSYAFQNASALTDVALPKSLTTLGNYAFSASGVKFVSFGEGITTIGNYVFKSCSNLEELSLPASLTTFGTYCFEGCSTKFATVNYAGTLAQWCAITLGNTKSAPTAYGAGLYIGGELVTSVTDSDNITAVSNYVFYGSTGIKEVDLSVNVGNYAFYSISTLENVTLGEGCANLGGYAFGKCANLKKIILPASVVTVGTAPFDANVDALLTTAGPVGSGCSIEYAWSDAIPANVFYNCRSLVSVTVIKSIANVGANAFYGASNIAKVYFEGSKLKWANIVFESGNTVVSSIEPICVASKDDVFFIDLKVVGEGKAQLSAATAVAGDEITITLSGYEEAGYMPGSINVDGVAILGNTFPVTGNHSVVVTFEFYKTVKYRGQEYVSSNGNWASYVLYEDGELYVYGKGDTGTGSVVASSHADEAKSLRISEDITRITNNSFKGFTELESVTVPAYITYIGSYAFRDCTSLESVTISSASIQTGDSVFYGCTALKDVNLPYGMSVISSSMFYKCSGLEYISIPSSVTSIGTYAFYECTSLRYILLHSGVQTVGNYAFRYDDKIDSVFYVGTAQQWQSMSVGSYNNDYFSDANIRFVSSEADVVKLSVGKSENGIAHLNCTMAVKGDVITMQSLADPGYKLKTFFVDGAAVEGSALAVNGDHTVTAGFAFYKTPTYSWQCGDSVWAALYENGELSIWGFGDMNKFSNQTANAPGWREYADEVKTAVIEQGVTSVGTYAFYNCTELAGVSIPSTVTVIGSNAFYYCQSLKAVTVPDAVTVVNDYTFNNCESLESVVLPDGIERVGNSAFINCASLKGITLPAELTTLGEYAFSNCTSLDGVVIPAKVASVGKSAFNGCKSLTSLEFMGDAPTVASYSFPSTKAGEFIILYHENTTGWTSPLWNGYYTACIESMGSDYSALDSANTNSQGLLFTLNDESMTAVVGTNQRNTANNSGYYGAENGNVVIPDTVTKNGRTYKVIGIGSYAFSGNKAVKTVALGANVSSVAPEAFLNCPNFAAFTVAAASNHYKAVGGILFDWGQYSLYCYPSGKTGDAYTVPSSVKNVGTYAFAYNTHLKEVTVNSNVASIGSMSFAGCTSLEKMTLPYIGKSLTATSYDAEFAVIFAADTSGSQVPESLKEVVITGGKLSDNAFESCRYIERITLPANDTEIPYYAFNYCCSLRYLAFADTVDELAQLGEGHLVIPERITYIDYEAFRCCYGFEYVHIPASVASMGSNVFIECKYVKKFIVDEDNANFCSDEWGVLFTKDKTQLINYPAARVWPYYNVPDEVTTIKNYAFYYAENLVNLYIPRNAQTFYYSSIAACPGLTVCTWLDSDAYTWAAGNNIPVWAMDNYTLQGIEIYSLPEKQVFAIGDEDFDGLYVVKNVGGRQLQLDDYTIVYDKTQVGVQTASVVCADMSAEFDILLYGEADIYVDFGELTLSDGTQGFAAAYDVNGKMVCIEAVTVFNGRAVMVIPAAKAKDVVCAKLFVFASGTLVPVDNVVVTY